MHGRLRPLLRAVVLSLTDPEARRQRLRILAADVRAGGVAAAIVRIATGRPPSGDAMDDRGRRA